MPRIQRLSASVINKIAAGEVIERPASVVKELVENSLDAGATRIDVAIEQGGVDLVRVVDNGGGIEAEDLPLAVSSHATSKLQTADDLFRVRTLGFRGEALASIAEISRFSIASRPADRAAGAELEVVGGERQPLAPAGCPPGTVIEVRNLFFNTPVRRKFLRSTQTEAGHVIDAFARLALAHPQTHFTLRHNQRSLYDLPAVDDWLHRIAALHGEDLAGSLFWVESRDAQTTLRGYVAHPSQSRSNPKMQYLFLNGRHIRDRALQHALTEAYRGLLLTGRHCISFLRFDMPPDEVDVNVHPTKLEVRFQDGGRLYSQLLGTLRTKFLSSDLTHRLDAAPAVDEIRDAHDPRQAEAVRADLVAWAKGELSRSDALANGPASSPDQPGFATPVAALACESDEAAAAGPEVARSGWRQDALGFAPFATPRAPLELHRVPAMGPSSVTANVLSPATGPSSATANVLSPATGLSSATANVLSPATGPSSATGPSPAVPRGEQRSQQPFARAMAGMVGAVPAPHVAVPASGGAFAQPGGERGAARVPWRPTALQVYNCYLVAESDEGVVVIDQHALHESILYEQFRDAVAVGGALERQQLLVPEPVDLGPTEAAAVLERGELLARLGVQVEPFGGATVLVSSVPAMFRSVNPAEMLASLVERLMAGQAELAPRDLLDEMLHMMACKAAIKAGDRLTPEEITALLEQRHLATDSHHCPHGRPTALVFTRAELDRQFMRT